MSDCTKPVLDIPRKSPGRISNRPSDEELIRLYAERKSEDIAAMYGVAASTVRSWLCRLRKERGNEHEQTD